MARVRRYSGNVMPPLTNRYVVPADGWIPQSRLPDWVSSRTGRATNKEFWRWAIDHADLEVLRKGNRRFVSLESLRRYTGCTDG